MSARPRAQHPAPGLLAPPAPGTVPGSEHSPYLKAVLAAGYAQHTARRATTGCGDYCDYCDAAPLEVPDVADTEGYYEGTMNAGKMMMYKTMSMARLKRKSEEYARRSRDARDRMQQIDPESAEYMKLSAMVDKMSMEMSLIAKAMSMITNSSTNRGTYG